MGVAAEHPSYRISIALMLLIVTSVVPTEPALPHLQRPRPPASPPTSLEPFMHGMHVALWVLVAFSLMGAAVSALRGRHVAETEAEAEPRPQPA